MNNGLLRVLLVEDMAADAELCVDALGKAGFSVDTDVCSSAENFEQLIGSKDYDVILADYNLKVWDVYQPSKFCGAWGRTFP
jgi:CheY-like chemotaxis protein